MLIYKILKICHIISKEEYQTRKMVSIVEHSEFFDKNWYLQKYPDIKNDEIEPSLHYCQKGWKEGRDPGPKFSTKCYIQNNPDVEQSGVNPLVHYEKHGRFEGRKIFPQAVVPAPLKQKKEYRDCFFSVIVASYNYQDLIQETLESLIGQTYKNFEVIVVDDGSTDNSVKVIKKYAQKYPFIKLYQHPNGENRGLPETVLLGVQKSKGEYIAFCESDDFWTLNHLWEVNRKINETSNAQIIVNDVNLIGDEERCKTMGNIVEVRKKAILEQNGVFTDAQLRACNYIVSFSCCCVNHLLLKSCDFVGAPRKAELDWWLWRQICNEAPICYINQKLTYYRMHQSYIVRESENFEKKRASQILHEELVQKLDQLVSIRQYEGVNSLKNDETDDSILEEYNDTKQLVKSLAAKNFKGLKICYISATDKDINPIQDPSCRYRCYHPAEVLSKEGACACVISLENFVQSPSFDYDIYVFHRPNAISLEVIEQLKAKNKILIADYDDLIFGSPDTALECSAYKNGKLNKKQALLTFKNNLEALCLFDNFTVSTENLAKEVVRMKRKAHVAVVHNFIPESIQKMAAFKQIRVQPKDPNMIMYCTGTLSHNKDFEVIEDTLLKALDKNTSLKLVVFGLLSASGKLGKHPRVYFHDLVDYWDLFAHMSLAGFTIAPLENSYFNDCKSNVKFLESAVAGTTLIATPIPDMERMSDARILLAKTPDDWDKILSELDKVNLKENTQCNYDYLVKNCGPESFLSELNQLFKNMEV